MKILITGAAGFVGPHVHAALVQAFGDPTITPTSLMGGDHPQLGPTAALDVGDPEAVTAAVARLQPDCVVHLAGIAAPAAANADWRNAWRTHVDGTLNVAHAIMAHAPKCVLLFVGSGQVYGDSARAGRPLTEETLLAPTDAYAASKAAADLAVGALAHRGLRAVRLRPFNHTGPGQTEDFFVPGMAMQIARIEAGLQPPAIRVGNLDAARDFLHVADVAEAYVAAIRHAAALPVGAIVNVASGTAYRMHDLLDRLVRASRVPIGIEPDPARLRASDLPFFVGDPSRAHHLLDWRPRHSIDETLAEVLAHCRQAVAANAA